MTLEAGRYAATGAAATMGARRRHVVLRRCFACRRRCRRLRDRVGPSWVSITEAQVRDGSGFVGDEGSSPFPLAKLSVEIRKTSPWTLSHSNNGHICHQPPSARADGRRLLRHFILCTFPFISVALTPSQALDTSSPRLRALSTSVPGLQRCRVPQPQPRTAPAPIAQSLTALQ